MSLPNHLMPLRIKIAH